MADVPGVEYDINKRWETGIPHHPESKRLFKRLQAIDWQHCNDYFCWKWGGDGDNGETLMYELDILFEERVKEGDGNGNSGSPFERA